MGAMLISGCQTRTCSAWLRDVSCRTDNGGGGRAMVAGLGLEAANMLFKAMEPVGSLTATAVLPPPPGFLLVRA